MTKKEIKSFITKALKVNGLKILQADIVIAEHDFTNDMNYVMFTSLTDGKSYKIFNVPNTEKFDISEYSNVPVESETINPPVVYVSSAEDIEEIISDFPAGAVAILEQAVKEINNEHDFYNLLTEQIQADYKSISIKSLAVACSLYCVYESEFYKLDNFVNIYDYAKDKFGIARGTTSNFINIVKRFGAPVCDNVGDFTTYKIADSFQDYNVSQLILLTHLTNFEIENNELTAEKSVREIKRIITELAENCTKAITANKGVKEKEPKTTNTKTDVEEEQEDALEEQEDNTGDMIERCRFSLKISTYYDIARNKDVISKMLDSVSNGKWKLQLIEVK